MQENPNLEEIWDKEVWLEQARVIINELNHFPLSSKISLILRHSQRFEPKLTDKNLNKDLTSQGRTMARFFGKKLPKTRTIRLFHSPINRCKETAEEIHIGFKEYGGESIFKGECNVLWGIGQKRYFFISEKQKRIELFSRWKDGVYKPEDMPLLLPFCQRAAKAIWNQINDEPKNGIDIYISHDWHINTFRFGWFNLPPDDRWIDYLGGFAFTFEKDYILLLDYGKFKSMEIPHWWIEKRFL